MASKFLGKYELIERLGRGGMAEVYRAYQASLERYVAIKLLHPFLADDPEFKERFEREARNVARLRHPNIVQVYDFDFDPPSESYYMVMELVDGQTLKDRLGDLNGRGEHQSEMESLRIARDAASAMGYAHERGVIHRDVKPPNLIFDQDGRVVLTDFGIAKIITGGTQLTASGTMVGTPAYMSPEQGLGEKGDERSDLYSLGVIMFQMVTGKLPYDAESPLAVILKHVNQPIPSLREFAPYISPAFEAVIYKAMAKQPSDRYQTADELIRALDAVVPSENANIRAALTVPIPAQAAHDSAIVQGKMLTPSPIRRLTPLAATDTPPFTLIPPVTAPPALPPSVPPIPPNGAGGDATPLLPSNGTTPEVRRRNSVSWRMGLLTLIVILLLGGSILLLNGGQLPPAILAFIHSPTPTVSATSQRGVTGLTFTNTATFSPTAALTATATVAVTSTPTITASNTPTVTPSVTPSLTSTLTPSLTSTLTPSPTITLTATDTLPPTETPSPLPNITATFQAATSAYGTAIALQTSTSVYATIGALAETQLADTTPTPNYTQTALACRPQYRLITPDPGSTPQVLKANQNQINITVTLLNTGDCDWLPGTALRFDVGNVFNAPLLVNMSRAQNVPPNGQATFIVTIATPTRGNLYNLTSRLTISPGDRQVDPVITIPIRVYEAS